jgi:hypothetical protein
VGKPEGKMPLERPRRRWANNTNTVVNLMLLRGCTNGCSSRRAQLHEVIVSGCSYRNR